MCLVCIHLPFNNYPTRFFYSSLVHVILEFRGHERLEDGVIDEDKMLTIEEKVAMKANDYEMEEIGV